MNRPETVQLEPLEEVKGDTYRFGYRIVGTSNCASVIEIPTLIVERTLQTRAKLTVRVGPDGTVISSIVAAGSTLELPSDVTSIEALVQRAVNTENLRMEEATEADLGRFLQQL